MTRPKTEEDAFAAIGRAVQARDRQHAAAVALAVVQYAEVRERDLSHAVARLRGELAALRPAAERVVDALLNEGPHPDHHRRVLARHRAQWPTLWAALDRLREAVDADERPA